MTRSKNTTAKSLGVALAVTAALGTTAVVGWARSAQTNPSGIVRTALGVTVERPYGETTSTVGGFSGGPGFRRFDLPHGAASRITLGPDGALWFVDQEGDLARFDTRTKRTRAFDTGGATGEIVTGIDGRIYAAVSSPDGSQVTVLTPEGRKIRDVDVPMGVGVLQPASDGVWFASSDDGVPIVRHQVGRIAPSGSVRTSPVSSWNIVDGAPPGSLRPDALARLSDGTIAAVGSTVFRFSSPDQRTEDPVFTGLAGDARFGPVSDAVGGPNGDLFVLRKTQGETYSSIWLAKPGAAGEPFVAIPDEPIRAAQEGSDSGTLGNAATVLQYGPDGKLWFVSWRSQGDIASEGYLGRVDGAGHLTEWRMPYADGDQDSAVVTDGLAIGTDGNLWFPDLRRGKLVRFGVPGQTGWRSQRPAIVSSRRAKDRAEVRIRCVGQPGKLCFGDAWLTRSGKRVGPKLAYAVEANVAKASPEIVRYLKLPKASGGLRVRLSNGPSVRLR